MGLEFRVLGGLQKLPRFTQENQFHSKSEKLFFKELKSSAQEILVLERDK